jgi:hypothetical protein
MRRPGVRPRTSLWWNPRTSSPSPPSARCTIRVLSGLGANPNPASSQVNRANAASACHRSDTSPPRHRRTAPVRHAHSTMPGPAGAGRCCTAAGDHPTLGRPGDTTPHRPALHHPGAQDAAHQTEQRTVTDTFLDRLETLGDIGLHHPAASPPGLVDEYLQGIMRRPARSEPKRAVEHVGFEDRLEHDLHRRLHDPVTHRGDRQRPPFVPTRLRDEHPPGRQRPIPPVPHLRGHLVKEPVHAVLLDLRHGDTVDTRSAAVAAHVLPRPFRHVPAVDLVEQRIRPGPGPPRRPRRAARRQRPPVAVATSPVSARRTLPGSPAEGVPDGRRADVLGAGDLVRRRRRTP